MRCKKHLPDLSSTVGVCATCLRERLIALIAAQAQAQAQLTRVTSRASDECSRNSDPNPPPPLIFPRSVSPYVSRRKSDYAAGWHDSGDRRERLFYSTPQLGPTFYAANSTYNGNTRSLKKRLSKFWIFSNLFRSRSEKFQSDPSFEQSSSASPSWFSTIFPARRKNQDRTGMTEDSSVGARRRYRTTDRGMSPWQLVGVFSVVAENAGGDGAFGAAVPARACEERVRLGYDFLPESSGSGQSEPEMESQRIAAGDGCGGGR
ncbi:hypothetical protein SESBI_00181 [Sesbania bispinosa]|nr:hypothetical protein SESBI_00181 [Sesbania bispinosa]